MREAREGIGQAHQCICPFANSFLFFDYYYFFFLAGVYRLGGVCMYVECEYVSARI